MKICLDAGHYGKYNQSPENKAYYESVVMLKLTKYQKEYLEEYKDVEVVLTRTDERDMGLYDRGYKAKGCKLFLSNHTNACGTESVDYPVVYGAFDNRGNAKEFGLTLAQAIQTTMKTRQAAKTATRVGSSGNNEYYGVLRGARAAGLNHYYIVEHSFHTNKAATNWLLSDDNLKKLAKAEVEAIAAYFGLVKKSVPVTPVTSASRDFLVTVTADVLNVRDGAGTDYKINTTVKEGDVFTIVETSKDGKWGKLKSGAGWISLAYTIKR